jgi:hypothetical protein
MSQTERSPRPPTRPLAACVIVTLLAAATVVVHGHANFSLVSTFAESWDQMNGGCAGDTGLCSDGASYVDLDAGVDSWSNDVGNIVISTMNSPNRRLCVDFPASPTHVYDAAQHTRFVGTDANVLDACYRGTLNTLANGEYGATDVGHLVGSPQPISAVLYFFRNGIQYELRWARGGSMGLPYTAPPLKISHASSPDTWFLETYLVGDVPAPSTTCPNCQYVEPQCPEGCATLMVFSEQKPRGRIVLANYVMPFGLTAATAENNQRKVKGRKG